MSTTIPRKPRIFTIGHSDRTIDQFIEILGRSSIRLVADIRSNPASARYPWFERHALAAELEKRGLSYRWFRGLGGRRPDVEGQDVHTALTDPGDRAYAEAMNTSDFAESCDELIGLAASTVAAVMCAEADPEDCHRRLLADKLFRMGVRVVHIMGLDDAKDHVPHPGLVIGEDNRLIYEKKQLSLI